MKELSLHILDIAQNSITARARHLDIALEEGPEAITRAVLDNAYNGAIVLMHDGGGNREQDIEALPGIIDGLRERGYRLVTVGELMKLDGRVPQEVIDGAVAMPADAAMPAL